MLSKEAAREVFQGLLTRKWNIFNGSIKRKLLRVQISHKKQWCHVDDL